MLLAELSEDTLFVRTKSKRTLPSESPIHKRYGEKNHYWNECAIISPLIYLRILIYMPAGTTLRVHQTGWLPLGGSPLLV